MEVSAEWQGTDVLSPAAIQLLQVDADEAYQRLTPAAGGNEGARPLIRASTAEALFARPVLEVDSARAALAALWLYHDWLDEAHRIVQDLQSPTGSMWHAIVHRREGDFSNAKYWYARCRHHPIFATIAEKGRDALRSLPPGHGLDRLVVREWDPAGFVDVVEAIHQKPTDPVYAAAVRLQQVEWRVLFNHCVRAAVGPTAR